MNQNLGLIGKKLGNTQVFNEDGSVTRVTAIQVGPCRVVGKRTVEKDGYSALVLGFGERTEKRLSKAQKGVYEKLKQKPSAELRELRLSAEEVAKYELGQELKPSEIFTPGQKVDVTGLSRGRGFQGVMRRWNMKGAATNTHGSHEYKRHGGAIGTNMTPGRTLANLKMPGQWGNERITVQNLVVARVLEEQQVVLIEGAVPGSRNTIVTVRGAIKARKKVAA
jgi:large subunit ribosomal protein L3